MNSFSSNNLYIGTLMIEKEGQSDIYKENVYLIYEEKTDSFYQLEQTLNDFIDLSLNPKLNEETKSELREKIKKYEYNYKQTGQEDHIYVDVTSLKIIGTKEKNTNNRRK